MTLLGFWGVFCFCFGTWLVSCWLCCLGFVALFVWVIRVLDVGLVFIVLLGCLLVCFWVTDF